MTVQDHLSPFEFFPHTADIGLVARGQSLEDLFANAGRGLFALMVSGDFGPAVEAVRVETTAEVLEDLLVAWLNDLLFLFESEGFIGLDYRVHEVSPRKIVADVRGERYDEDRHIVSVGVKAATYHNVTVEHNDRWLARVILDV